MEYKYNETLKNCFINPNEYFQNGTVLDYDSCPLLYNSSRRSEALCCFLILVDTFPKSKFENWMIYSSSTCLLVPAILFNLLSFIVLSHLSKANKYSNSINFFMKSLCIFDSLTIIFKFINEFFFVRNPLRKSHEKYMVHPVSCKTINFFNSVFELISTYILILMSINKLIGIAFPLKAKTIRILRPNISKLICLLVVILSLGYTSFYISNVKIINESNINITEDCSFDSNEAILLNVYNYVIRTFLPILILCACNISIICLLAKESKNMQSINKDIYKKNSKKCVTFDSKKRISNRNKIELVNTANSSKKMIHLDENNNTAISNSTFRDVCDETDNLTRLKHKKSQYKKQNELCKRNQWQSKKKLVNLNYTSFMLLATSFGFIIFNLPHAIITIHNLNFKERQNFIKFVDGDNTSSITFSKKTVISTIKFDFFVYLAYFLLDLNYVADFFFYFLSGITFRRKLYFLIRLVSKKFRALYRYIIKQA